MKGAKQTLNQYKIGNREKRRAKVKVKCPGWQDNSTLPLYNNNGYE